MTRSLIAICLLTSLATLSQASTAKLPGKVQGQLTSDDLTHPNSGAPMDLYEFEAGIRQWLSVRMTSPKDNLDTYLYLTGPSGHSYANDDTPDEQGSLLQLVTSEDGFWEIAASSCGGTGSYELEVELRNIDTLEYARAELTSDDKRSPKGGEYFDKLELPVAKGRIYIVQMVSSSFDTYLSVYEGENMYTNDNALNKGSNSQVVFTATQDGTAEIFFTSADTEQKGRYNYKTMVVAAD